MKYRIFAVLILSVLAMNLGGSTFADTKAKKAGMNQLVPMLPASDGVIILDVKRFVNDALPQVLAGNQPLLGKVTGHMDSIKSKIGIDVRRFDQVAIGVSARQVAEKNYDVDPVVVARGQMTSASLVGAAKLASNGKYREERVGARVMFVFDEAIALDSTTKVAGSIKEIGLASLDDRTIAFGDVGRVRATLEAKTRVGSDLLVMLEKSPTAVATFAIKPPAGLKSFIPMENDELGKSIDSIQYIYGNADVIADKATFHMTARTLQNAQAASLFETMEGLQMIGRAFLGGAKGADKQVYARLVQNVKLSVKLNEVTLDLVVPQADLDVLVGMIK